MINNQSIIRVMGMVAVMLSVSFSGYAQLGGALNKVKDVVKKETPKQEQSSTQSTENTVQPETVKTQETAQAPAVVKSAAVTTDDKVYPTDSDEGVVINGVKWATRNVAEPGAFTANPSEAGMFYQWNRKKAYNVTDIDIRSGWHKNNRTGKIWEKSNDPCPAGWRPPTYEEIKTLLDYNKVKSEWTTLNGVKGRRFTDKVTGNSIFIPATGIRSELGTLIRENSEGNCWSSSEYGGQSARHLSVHSGTAEVSISGLNSAMSIRAVAE